MSHVRQNVFFAQMLMYALSAKIICFCRMEFANPVAKTVKNATIRQFATDVYRSILKTRMENVKSVFNSVISALQEKIAFNAVVVTILTRPLTTAVPALNHVLSARAKMCAYRAKPIPISIRLQRNVLNAIKFTPIV